MFSAGGRARTCDHRVNSAALYLLSYPGTYQKKTQFTFINLIFSFEKPSESFPATDKKLLQTFG